MQRRARAIARPITRPSNAQTCWVVGALMASLVIAALWSLAFAARPVNAWSAGSLVTLAAGLGSLGLALHRSKRSGRSD